MGVFQTDSKTELSQQDDIVAQAAYVAKNITDPTGSWRTARKVVNAVLDNIPFVKNIYNVGDTIKDTSEAGMAVAAYATVRKDALKDGVIDASEKEMLRKATSKVVKETLDASEKIPAYGDAIGFTRDTTAKLSALREYNNQFNCYENTNHCNDAQRNYLEQQNATLAAQQENNPQQSQIIR